MYQLEKDQLDDKWFDLKVGDIVKIKAIMAQNYIEDKY